MPAIAPSDSAPYRYRPGLFFLAAFAATWIPWFVAVYQSAGSATPGAISPFGYVGLLGPLVVTVVFMLTSGSRVLRADFLRRFHPRQLRPAYVLLALAIPPLAMLLSIALSLPLGQSAAQFRPSGSGLFVVAIILAPIIEEISWRGYGVDSLRAKLGGLTSTLLFAVLWALWHAPLVLIPGTYQHEVASLGQPLYLVNFFAGTIPAAIIANWLYYVNGRSILIGVLFHAAANGAAELLSAEQVAKCIATVVWAIIAVVIILRDRTTFAGGPRSFLNRVDPES